MAKKNLLLTAPPYPVERAIMRLGTNLRAATTILRLPGVDRALGKAAFPGQMASGTLFSCACRILIICSSEITSFSSQTFLRSTLTGNPSEVMDQNIGDKVKIFLSRR